MSDITTAPTVAEAAKQAIETSGQNDVVCIAGSLYVVGEAKEAIEKGLLNLVNKQRRQ